MNSPVFERDIIYSTGNLLEPGSIHISVLKPEKDGKLPLFISPRSDHNPLDYFDTIIQIIQADVFDRARIDIRNYGIFFLETGDSKYIKLFYKGGRLHVEQ